MTKNKTISLLAICILVGSLTAIALAATGTTRWEYQYIDGEALFEGKSYAPKNGQFANKQQERAYFVRCLNEVGAEGWELVGNTPQGYLFKRQQ